MNIGGLIDEREAAQLLGLSIRTLQAWRLRAGGPQYVKIGRSVRYRREDLEAFVSARVVSSTAAADALQRVA